MLPNSNTQKLIAIIGAGPGGICMAAKLKMAGIEDFVIYERADDLGGSWRDNDYPGIGVDIPATSYQYTFARNPSWTRLFPKGREVYSYHAGVAKQFGLYDHLQLNTNIVKQIWNEDESCWHLHRDTGEVLKAKFLVTAVGAFINPKSDDGLPGLESFTGKIQKPTDWDHSYDHRDKQVVVVGTGASSVQITPAIAPEVKQLTVFQRTPVWCLPKPDLTFGRIARIMLKVPGVQAAADGAMLSVVEFATRGIVTVPPAIGTPVASVIDKALIRGYRRFILRTVKDPDVAKQLTPSFGPLVKRPTTSNGYLKAFNRENVKLVASPIKSIVSNGVVDENDVHYPADMLVLATGYELFSDPESYKSGTIVGRDGFDLAEFFARDGLQAYESVSVPGLPNRWMVVGPYSWTGTGWHTLVEISADHIVRAIQHAISEGTQTVEISQSAHDAYHRKIKKRGRNVTNYFNKINAGVRTYYVNSQGDMPYIRPSTVIQARRASKKFPLDDYNYNSGQ